MIPFDLDLVRGLSARATRDRAGQYVVEGVRFLATAVDAGARIDGLVVCPSLLESVAGRVLVRRLRRAGVPALDLGAAEFAPLARLTDGAGRGVLAVVRQRWRAIDALESRDLWLAVERVRSPGNLGSLLRTCVATGVRGVIAVGDADLHDPGCVRATMGALAQLDFARMTPEALLALVRRDAARLVAASPDGSVDFRAASYRGATVLLVGSEREGVSEPMRDACDTLVRIPMRGRVDSLNLAVAGSLVLYEAFGQRSATRRMRARRR